MVTRLFRSFSLSVDDDDDEEDRNSIAGSHTKVFEHSYFRFD